MRKIIYLPLEHIENRYTTHLDRDIISYLNKQSLPYVRIYPDVMLNPKPQEGMFLNAGYTMAFKNLQMAYLAEMYAKGQVNDNDIIFTSDIWFPGLEAVTYLNHFYKVRPRLHGILHAGSFTDTDEVRKMERWAHQFENMIFDIADRVFVASNFLWDDVIQKRIIEARKLDVTPFPLDFEELDKHFQVDKENIVVFNGRNHPEKQPELFYKLERELRHYDWVFVNTQRLEMPKDDYYNLLGKAKVVVSFALQENYGFGIAEAVHLGCIPVVPNRLVYKELYGDEFRYNSWDDCVYLVKHYMNTDIENRTDFEAHSLGSIKEWFQI